MVKPSKYFSNVQSLLFKFTLAPASSMAVRNEHCVHISICFGIFFFVCLLTPLWQTLILIILVPDREGKARALCVSWRPALPTSRLPPALAVSGYAAGWSCQRSFHCLDRTWNGVQTYWARGGQHLNLIFSVSFERTHTLFIIALYVLAFCGWVSFHVFLCEFWDITQKMLMETH